jgi:hypothetical protein
VFIPLIATACFSHRGRQITVGQAINVTPIEAAAYTYQRVAKFISSKTDSAPTPEPRRSRRRRVEATTE